MLTIVTEAPLSGRARVVVAKAFRKIAPLDEFEWRECGDELPTGVSVLMTNYDNRVFHRYVDTDTPILKGRGYRYETAYGPVVPTLSPWLVAKGKMNLLPVIIWDVMTAMKEQELPAPEFPLADLTLYPMPDEFREWCREAEAGSFVAVDLETQDSTNADDEDNESTNFEITRASMAREDFKAITWPWQEPFTRVFKELMLKRQPKVFWNGYEFDLPRLAAKHVEVMGQRVDAMWLFHFLQPSLPRGLGHVSTYYDRVPEWKSIGAAKGTDDELYSCMDARQTAVNYVGICRALEARRLQ